MVICKSNYLVKHKTQQSVKQQSAATLSVTYKDLCKEYIIQLSPGWLHPGDQEGCVWGSLAAAVGISPVVNVGCQESSRGPASCWKVTPDSVAESLGPACPAFSGPAGLWLRAGCCSSSYKHWDQAAEKIQDSVSDFLLREMSETGPEHHWSHITVKEMGRALSLIQGPPSINPVCNINTLLYIPS